MEEPRDGIVWQEFHDRTAGLVIFGLIQAGLGALCLLFVPLLLLITTFNPQAMAGQAPGSMAGGAFVYGALGAIFLTLGIGSLLTRRWARSLSLAVWSLALIYGIVGLLSWALLLAVYGDSLRDTMVSFMQAGPGNPPAQMPPGMLDFMVVFVSVMIVAMGILLPLPFVLFYRSRHVKATCEWRDPKTRWTDRCPLPVLIGALLILGYGAYAIQGLVVQRLYVLGILFQGPAALVGAFVIIAAAVAAAVGLGRMRPWGWWLALALVMVHLVTWGWAEYTGDVLFFQMMDDQTQAIMRQTEGAEAFMRAIMHWGAAMHAIYLLFLFWILRYFRATRRPAAVV